MAKAVFFDRDGTLNVDTGYLYRISDFVWTDGAVEAIKYCNDKGFLVIVVTNQSGVARGYYTEADIKVLHEWMNEQLKAVGAHIDAFYYCPHHEEGTVAEYSRPCGCRKPSPKLVDEACLKYSIDKEQSVLIGDADRDILCARNAGIRGARYLGGNLLDFVKAAIG